MIGWHIGQPIWCLVVLHAFHWTIYNSPPTPISETAVILEIRNISMIGYIFRENTTWLKNSQFMARSQKQYNSIGRNKGKFQSPTLLITPTAESSFLGQQPEYLADTSHNRKAAFWADKRHLLRTLPQQPHISMSEFFLFLIKKVKKTTLLEYCWFKILC